jgi:hypothetical protein
VRSRLAVEFEALSATVGEQSSPDAAITLERG